MKLSAISCLISILIQAHLTVSAPAKLSQIQSQCQDYCEQATSQDSTEDWNYECPMSDLECQRDCEFCDGKGMEEEIKCEKRLPEGTYAFVCPSKEEGGDTMSKGAAARQYGHLKGGTEELSENQIKILLWTKFQPQFLPFHTNVLNPDQCSILKIGSIQQPPVSQVFDKPCRITYDRKYLNDSHAVVFHSPDLHYSGYNLPPAPRPKNQVWIWHQMESPSQTRLDLKAYRNIFNWTMTYRRDSDVYFPYGSIFPRNISNSLVTSVGTSALDNPLDRKSLEMKSGLAAWIVSSCNTSSQGEYFVKELQKYIPVDIFGSCGDKKCPQLQDKGYFPCYDYIHSRYKFILSFENSLCVDYITEKFFLALQYNMVPVVYGGGIDGQMDYLAIAPKNSFIDARLFDTPQDVANYLIYMDKNDDEYLEYFEWKTEYQVVYKDYGLIGLGWCNLCQRVFEQTKNKENPLWNKWYSDLDTWWKYISVGNNQLHFISQSKSPNNPVGQSSSYNLAKLKSSCVLPKHNFTSYWK